MGTRTRKNILKTTRKVTPPTTFPQHPSPFLGHENFGLNPFSILKNGKNIVCKTSYESFVVPILGCFAATLMFVYNYLYNPNETKSSLIMMGIFLTLAYLFGLSRIFIFALKRRKLVFNGDESKIELTIGKKLITKISKQEIIKLEMGQEEREQKSSRFGTLRWTVYFLFVVLQSKEKICLLEADRKPVIHEIKENVERLFGMI